MSDALPFPETRQLSLPFPAPPASEDIELFTPTAIRCGFLIRVGPFDAVTIRLGSRGGGPGGEFTCLKTERLTFAPTPARLERDPDPDYFALPEYWPLERWVMGATLAAVRPRGRILDRHDLDGRIARVLPQAHAELLRRVNPTVLEVQEACRAATGEVAGILLFPQFYLEPNRFLLRDMLRYPAACVAALRLHELARPEISSADPSADPSGDPSAERRGVGPGDRLGSGRPRWDAADLEVLLPALRDWRRRLSVDGRGSRAVNLALDRFGADTPPDLLLELRRLRLPRPIAERSEFLLLTGWSRLDGRRSESAFRGATTERTRRAMEIISEEVGRRLDPDLDHDVLYLAEYLLDSRLDYGGDLVGFARRAVEWHRREHERTEAERRAWEARFGAADGGPGVAGGDEPPPPPETPTARPPIPPPEDDRIRLLETSGAVVDCGFRLRLCLRGYAAGAVDGRYYLFLVRFEGNQAVVQVDSRGLVVQSRGPANRETEASRWAAAKLAEWGRGFPNPGATTGTLGEETGE